MLTDDDAHFVIELVNEPAWLRFIGDRHVRRHADAVAYIGKAHAMYAQHGVCLQAVELRATGDVIGLCGLIQRAQFPEVDLGYAFLERFRGQGFAREAAAAMLQFGHATLHRETILALTHPENDRSIALLKKLGFLPRSETRTPDGAVDSLVFAHTQPADPLSSIR
jgi:[ribosomal protein S5]-alanine N-acetyltransferase